MLLDSINSVIIIDCSKAQERRKSIPISSSNSYTLQNNFNKFKACPKDQGTQNDFQLKSAKKRTRSKIECQIQWQSICQVLDWWLHSCVKQNIVKFVFKLSLVCIKSSPKSIISKIKLQKTRSRKYILARLKHNLDVSRIFA